jgi:hypothetical protein
MGRSIRANVGDTGIVHLQDTARIT